MKLRILSDLHFEMPNNVRYFKKNPLIFDKDELVILAGDIGYLKDYPKKPFKDAKCLSINGNHEFYGCHKNVAIDFKGNIVDPFNNPQHNNVVVVEDVSFILTTLWSNADATAAGGIADYTQIRGMNLADMADMHRSCKEFIKTALKSSITKKNVVVTHHLPSYQLISPKWQGSPLNSAFASNCFHELDDEDKNKITLWSIGHTHENIDKIIDGVRFICNPFGYYSEFGPGQENKEFNPNLVIEI